MKTHAGTIRGAQERGNFACRPCVVAGGWGRRAHGRSAQLTRHEPSRSPSQEREKQHAAYVDHLLHALAQEVTSPAAVVLELCGVGVGGFRERT